MNQGKLESIQDDDEVFLLIDVWLGEKTQPWFCRKSDPLSEILFS